MFVIIIFFSSIFFLFPFLCLIQLTVRTKMRANEKGGRDYEANEAHFECFV